MRVAFGSGDNTPALEIIETVELVRHARRRYRSLPVAPERADRLVNDALNRLRVGNITEGFRSALAGRLDCHAASTNDPFEKGLAKSGVLDRREWDFAAEASQHAGAVDNAARRQYQRCRLIAKELGGKVTKIDEQNSREDDPEPRWRAFPQYKSSDTCCEHDDDGNRWDHDSDPVRPQVEDDLLVIMEESSRKGHRLQSVRRRGRLLDLNSGAVATLWAP